MESNYSPSHQDGFDNIPLSHPPIQPDISHADREIQETGFLSRQSTDEERLDDLCVLDSLEEILSTTQDANGRGKLKVDYSDFKSRPALEFFKKSVRVYCFPPGSDTCSLPSGEADSTKTFSDCVEDLKSQLRENRDTECTRTCVITMDSRSRSKKTGAALLYSWRKIFLTTAKQFQRKFDAPIKAILCLICHEWCLPTASDQDWTYIGTEKTKTRRIQRHSLCKDPFTFDSLNEVTLRLVWFKNVPTYKGWWRTYIFRDYTERPTPCFAQVVIAGANGSPRNMLILLDFDGNCRKWSRDTENHPFDRLLGTQTDKVILGILKSAFTIYNYLIEDTINFLQEVEEYLDEATYEVRRQPTTWRLQHLLCVEDSCREAMLGLVDAAELLSEISAAGGSNPSHPKEINEWFESTKIDVASLQQALIVENSRIREVRTMIKDQLEIKNQYRTSLLSVLAAIFVPFSFMSSLYGMNLKEPLWATHRESNNSARINATLPTDGADAIVEAIKSSGPHLFDYRYYWIATAPVVAGTLLVPTLLPPVFRWTIRNLIKNTAFVVPSLMVITVAISLATSIKQSFAAFTVIILFPFGLTALFYLCYSSVKETDQILWCGYAIIYGVSLWIDHYLGFRIIGTPKGPWTSGLLPPVYLGITQSPLMVLFSGDGKRRDSLRAWLLMVKGSDGTRKGTGYRILIGAVYYGVVTAYWYNFKDHGSLLAIPWALIIANRVIYNFFTNQRARYVFIWVAFGFIWALSVFIDLQNWDYSISGFFIAFFPMSAFFVYWAYMNNRTFVRKKIRDCTGSRAESETKPALKRKVTLPNSLPKQPTVVESPVSQPMQARWRDSASRRESS